jgi:ADP-ribosyl-[dinitrogen reductase] hydrolase
MIDNTALLQECFQHGVIRLRNADVLRRTPSPLPPDFDYQKIEGMLLGLAIGDALGAPTEGMLPSERHNAHGEIRDYLPTATYDLGPIGAVTDDSQLAFWTLEQLLEDGGLVPERLSDKFCSSHIYGIGNTVRQFIMRRKNQGLPWQLAATDSLGNGALMRIAPIVVPHLQLPTTSLYADAALDAMVTHNAFGNIAACVAFVDILWQLLGMRRAPAPEWWVETFVSTARELEGETTYSPSMPDVEDYAGPLWRFVEQVCLSALERHATVADACNHWGSGASLLETVPSVLHILALYGHDPEAAIIRAVNDARDNDTIAAIVGASVGALHGLAGLPSRWVKGLDGRIRKDGSVDVFRLVLQSKQAFWLQHT